MTLLSASELGMTSSIRFSQVDLNLRIMIEMSTSEIEQGNWFNLSSLAARKIGNLVGDEESDEDSVGTSSSEYVEVRWVFMSVSCFDLICVKADFFSSV